MGFAHSEHLPWCPVRKTHGTCYGCEWRRYAASLLIAVFFGGIEYTVGLYYQSVSAQGDAIHLFGDGLQSGVSALIAFLVFRHTLSGHHFRAWGAYLQALLLFIAGVFIIHEALGQRIPPREPLLIAVIGTLATSGAVLRFYAVHNGWHIAHSVRQLSGALLRHERVNVTALGEISHIVTDFATSIAVVIAGLWQAFTGNASVDQSIALYGIAPVVFFSALLVLIFARREHGHSH